LETPQPSTKLKLFTRLHSALGTAPRKLRPWFFGWAAALIFLLGWSFTRQVSVILAQPVTAWTEDVTADCAVVLTGGPSRIREGLDLLTRHSVQKLIISGVNPQAELRDIVSILPYYGEIRDQDVILERRSRTTFGNAQQTLPLVEVLHCRDLVLITSRVHMYRAMRTFHAEFPAEFPIIPRAVIAGSIKPGRGEVTVEAMKSIFYSLWAY
jgi:uncharacterized SAM-binding protein YcdF (DUF218 family)